MTDIKAIIFAEIVALEEARYMRPGDITIPDYQATRGCERDQARRELERAVKAGLLVDAGLLAHPATGRQMRVYRRVDNEKGHTG